MPLVLRTNFYKSVQSKSSPRGAESGCNIRYTQSPAKTNSTLGPYNQQSLKHSIGFTKTVMNSILTKNKFPIIDILFVWFVFNDTSRSLPYTTKVQILRQTTQTQAFILSRSVNECNNQYLLESFKKHFYSSVRDLDLNTCFNIVRRPCSIFCLRRRTFVIFTLHYIKW